MQHVSGTAHGLQQWLIEVLVDFAAQPADVYVDDVGLRIEVIIPYLFQQHGAGDDALGVVHQVFQQAVFARLQGDHMIAALNGARELVEFEIGDAQGSFCRRGLARPARSRWYVSACSSGP